MKYRRLDDDGDYTFGAGQANYLNDREACAQAVKTRLLLFLAEWWENLKDGLPLWQKVLGARDLATAEQVIKERILKTQHVRGITAYQSFWDGETRQYIINCVIDTDYGEITLQEVTL